MISYPEAVEKIFSLRRLGMKLGLDNIKNFLNEIGNPQLKLKTFHVAGSNGKGSTVAFLSSILTEAGFKVGMFTSPHFVDFTERIKINGEEVEKEFVVEFVKKHICAIEEKRITFFEITTAMAFQFFYEKNVDYAVIETGLGGRLDATNTMNPLAEIITTISFEHTRILGNSLREIAREKAGIIRQNSKVFCGAMPNEALEEIEKIAKENNAELFSLKKFALITDDYVKLNLNENKNFTIYRTGFPGAHQLRNAALAVLTLNKTLGIDNPEVFSRGLLNVYANTKLSGRFEIYSQKPLVVLDAAHNAEGMEIFLKEFERQYSNKCRKRILIYGALRDKNVAEILKMFRGKFDKIYFTDIDFYRALHAEEILLIAKSVGLENAEVLSDRDKFIRDFLNRKSSNCLVITGSIYLLGEIKRELNN